MSQVKQKGKREKIVDIVFLSLFALFGVALIKILINVISGGMPSLFGYSLLNVKTDSMKPEIQAGDVILVKLVNEKSLSSIEEGEIIVYKGKINGVETTITHRLVENNADEGYFITKGDANHFEDDPVSVDKVVAVVVKEVGFLTSFYAFLSNGFSFVLIIIIPCLALIAMQIVSIYKNAKQLQQEKNQAETLKQIDEIKKKAVEDYLKSTNKSEQSSDETEDTKS